MPGPEEREKIWRTQIHVPKTPLAADVDFRALAERYPASGGDIKNAVLKAAQAAVAEPGADAEKRIAQHHFETAMDEVLAAKRVMDQTIFGAQPGAQPGALPAHWSAPTPPDAPGDDVRDDLSALATRVVEVEDALVAIPDAVRRLDAAREETAGTLEQIATALETRAAQSEAMWRSRFSLLMVMAAVALLASIAALAVAALV
jgi:hypothetical protein